MSIYRRSHPIWIYLTVQSSFPLPHATPPPVRSIPAESSAGAGWLAGGLTGWVAVSVGAPRSVPGRGGRLSELISLRAGTGGSRGRWPPSGYEGRNGAESPTVRPPAARPSWRGAGGESSELTRLLPRTGAGGTGLSHLANRPDLTKTDLN